MNVVSILTNLHSNKQAKKKKKKKKEATPSRLNYTQVFHRVSNSLHAAVVCCFFLFLQV